MLSAVMLSVEIYYCYAECHYTECHYAACHYGECYYDECHYAECHGSKKASYHHVSGIQFYFAFFIPAKSGSGFEP